ncbi:hypothetical protein FHW16_000140 [Phyllobacterium myrsinacearum]|uniref:Uncharacterized protein n=1 Tax=Phyllobacterium myrsinacearum TaxID=28101 RepID=A0A839EDF1_9HYPH|nr:hypothetical protein [Phyllobacterium myrsinacearum]
MIVLLLPVSLSMLVIAIVMAHHERKLSDQSAREMERAE